MFKEARLATTGGSDLEHNKYVGNVSRNMRLITSKDGGFLSCFKKMIEIFTFFTSLKQILFDNHEKDATKEKN